jgi:DNA modification methylase
MDYCLLQGDARALLRDWPDGFFNCCVTSPPYWGLRDYGVVGQLGLEATPEAYVARMVEVFREVRRVLRNDGTLFLNLGDSYTASGGDAHKDWHANPGLSRSSKRGGVPHEVACGTSGVSLKPKDLVGIPWRVAFALQADGWYLRSDIIWHKPNPMPESVTDRPTKSHEYMFLMAKSEKYWYDVEAVKEPSTNRQSGNVDTNVYALEDPKKGRTRANLHLIPARDTRNRRSVWTIATHPYKGAHFATFPPELVRVCLRAGCPAGGYALDPFCGSGTTSMVANQLGMNSVGIDLNADYLALAEKRMRDNK